MLGSIDKVSNFFCILYTVNGIQHCLIKKGKQNGMKMKTELYFFFI